MRSHRRDADPEGRTFERVRHRPGCYCNKTGIWGARPLLRTSFKQTVAGWPLGLAKLKD